MLFGKRAVWLATLGWVSACGGGSGDTACVETPGPLPAEADVANLQGDFTLTLIATRGPVEGDTIEAGLALQPYAADLQRISVAGGQPLPDYRAPLFGSATLALPALGAPNVGDVGSTDPQRPGVMVIERRGDPHGIIIRLGSEANRRDDTAFDGGYVVLQVHAVSDSGFAGTWRVGVTSTTAEGFFCAVK